jgi:hypothetical protein
MYYTVEKNAAEITLSERAIYGKNWRDLYKSHAS